MHKVEVLAESSGLDRILKREWWRNDALEVIEDGLRTFGVAGASGSGTEAEAWACFEAKYSPTLNAPKRVNLIRHQK